MPSKKSHRTSVKNAEYNRPIASRAKTLLRNSLELIEENKDKDQIQKSYKEAISALDKASQKGVIHKNNVARKKSKLAKKLNSK